MRLGLGICSGVVLLAGISASTGLFAADEKPEETSPVKVNVNGADEALSINLRAYLPALRHLECDSPAERIERYIESSQPKLTQGAEAMGYFSAQFNMTSSRLSNCWVLDIAVQPGLPVKVAKSTIRVTGEGASLEGFSALLAEKPYQAGDVLVTQKYEDLKTQLTRTASRLGFFDAEFVEREIQVDIDKQEAVINLHFDTGKRYQFGDVSVEQEVLDKKHLDRFLRVESGKPYDADELLRQQRVLESSGYYSDVQISSRYQTADNGKVPVEISAARNKRYAYTGKLGYATGDGFIVETGMEARWINQKGHKLKTALRFTQSGYLEAGFKYIVPLWKPEHEYAGLDVSWIRETDSLDFGGLTLNTLLDERKLELNYNRRTDSNWQQTAFVSFFEEKYELDIEGDVLADNTRLTLLGVRVNKTESDNALFPTEGWRLSAEVKGSHNQVLSDDTLLQAKVDGKYLQAFESGGKVIARGAVGLTWEADNSNMPRSLGFKAGGQDSVRGYDSGAIGEPDEYGDIDGGKNLLLASLEYEYPVAEKVSVAAFADSGSAFDDWQDYAFQTGWGVGVRYKSPLGPVRVDFAVPKDNSEDLHFYFSLGPDL